MKISLLVSTLILLVTKPQHAIAQDSSQTLSEVIIKAYENNRRLIDVAAPVSIVGKAELNRFNNISIVSAVNTIPGVKMEERSPGSYRINIRGSSLRSPFGVRNVKMYYNNIPYTDAGGNTYLNQLGFYNIQSLEIIKGPGSSIYGAGTGGVILINTADKNFIPGAALNFTAASFQSQNLNANIKLGKDTYRNIINYQHQTSDGYRNWTKMRRDVLTWDGAVVINKNYLQTHFLYSDLFYQTPGALTKSEYEVNPKASRPAAGTNPAATIARAAIYQKTFLAGFSYDQFITSNFKSITSLYGAFSKIKNLAIRNYEIRSEPHFGGRTIFKYSIQLPRAKFNFDFGAEFQRGFSSVMVYKNNAGNADVLQTNDEINNTILFGFTQFGLELASGWIINAGASINQNSVEVVRLSNIPATTQKRNYKNEIAPRFAILKKLAPDISAYASISKGFSPPTTAEILPSTSIINTQLNAEKGFNYEAGIKGNIQNKFYFDINAFYYRLQNTIVQRRDASGGDFFINAGSTNQNGIESFFSYQMINTQTTFVKNTKLLLSHTFNNFKYKDFKQGSTDFSGKKLPGVARHTISAGTDINFPLGIYSNLTYYYSDKIILNDANTESAAAYHLLGFKMGFKKNTRKFGYEIFSGVENIFDTKYSLGNDVNAAAGRYYNAAPGRNYYAGIAFNFFSQKK